MANPYAPPQHDAENAPVARPPSTDGSIVGSTTLTESDMAGGLRLANKRGQWFLPVLFGVLGFIVPFSSGIAVQLVAGPLAAAIGWFFWRRLFRSGAHRSVAGKTDRELTVTWRFTPETFEITNSTTYTRMQWSTVHRCLEGKDVFALYTSEAIVQIIPKRAFRPEDIEPLKGMFATHITPRKRPPMAARMLVLWVVLIVMFLAIWQFLQTVPR
jgi:hypothetical protein